MSHLKRKRSNSWDWKHSRHHDPPAKKHKKIRQTYLDTDSAVTSLDFHPTSHTFAASCFDGSINLYHIDELRTTSFSHSLHHPTEHLEDAKKSQDLQQLIENNEAKLERLKQLQERNNMKPFDEEEYDSTDNDDDASSAASDGSLSSASINMSHHASSTGIACKKSIFNHDGSVLIGAWKDSTIAFFDYQTSKLIHHFNNNEFDKEPANTALTAIKMYNHRTLITGDCDGIIRCWDLRMNLHKNNKSQRQYQYSSNDKIVSQMHRLQEHEDGINCFESMPNKYRLLCGSGDGQLSVWDLRKSSDLDAIKAEIQRKKARQKKLLKYKNRNELLAIFGDDEEEAIKPKTLKAISDRMSDEILSLCVMKFGSKICSGMTSGYMNVFSYNEWSWFADRVKGHSQYLNCIVKYDEDCCITGCHDGVVRLISLYPHKFLHSIGTHDLNPIDALAMSTDREFVASFASGNKRTMTKYNRTNMESLRRNHEMLQNEKDIIKIWDLSWHPSVLYKAQQKRIRDKYNRKRHLNQCRLAKGVKQFLELDDDDYDVEHFDDEEEEEEDVYDHKEKLKAVKDDYIFSDDDEDVEDDALISNNESNNEGESEDEGENVFDLEDDEDDNQKNRLRRIRYKTFYDRESWIKNLAYRKKIRPVGRHDVEQYNNKKFFRDLVNDLEKR